MTAARTTVATTQVSLIGVSVRQHPLDTKGPRETGPVAPRGRRPRRLGKTGEAEARPCGVAAEPWGLYVTRVRSASASASVR
jgi:hypothetical protein